MQRMEGGSRLLCGPMVDMRYEREGAEESQAKIINGMEKKVSSTVGIVRGVWCACSFFHLHRAWSRSATAPRTSPSRPHACRTHDASSYLPRRCNLPLRNKSEAKKATRRTV